MQLAENTDLNTALTEFRENWIWRTVLVLANTPGFNPSPTWIASRLKITVEKAVNALEGLQKLDLIEKADNTYRVKNADYQQSPENTSRFDLLKEHFRIAPQIISRLDENDIFTFQFFPGNKQLLNKYAPKFGRLFREMEAEAKSLNITDIMATELSFVQLTTNDGGEK